LIYLRARCRIPLSSFRLRLWSPTEVIEETETAVVGRAKSKTTFRNELQQDLLKVIAIRVRSNHNRPKSHFGFGQNSIINQGNMKNKFSSQTVISDTRISVLTFFSAASLLGTALIPTASAQLRLGSQSQLTPDAPLGFVEQKVTASDGTANSFFGSAAAITDTTAVIGADGDASFRGAAYVFTKSGDTWSEGQKLVASDGLSPDEFGYRVALDHGTLLVTAFSATVNGVAFQGAAYVFTLSGDTFSETQKLTASDGGLFDNFGAAVSVDGKTLVIGANGATVGANPAQGAAYVFTKSNGVWTEIQKLIADDGAAYDNFGLSVALQGSTILVGSPQAAIGGSTAQGAVYVFTNSGGSWTQTQKLTASDGASSDSFGESVAISDDNALIGAYGATVDSHPGAGAAYIFSNLSGTWSQMQKLTADDPGSFFNFGNTLALHGHKAVIAADVTTVDGHTSQGKVYIFREQGTDWTQFDTLVASDGTTDDFFGAALALGPGTVLVSTPHPVINGNSFQGAAYFFEHTPDSLP
jgi:hypothetical protein